MFFFCKVNRYQIRLVINIRQMVFFYDICGVTMLDTDMKCG